jgi:hypothetical protein
MKNDNFFRIAGVGIFANPSKKNMNWKQAKARFPSLSPFGDADRDGVKNRFDCHPFDFTRQDGEDEREQIERLPIGNLAKDALRKDLERQERRREQEQANENIARIAKQRRQQGRPFSL